MQDYIFTNDNSMADITFDSLLQMMKDVKKSLTPDCLVCLEKDYGRIKQVLKEEQKKDYKNCFTSKALTLDSLFGMSIYPCESVFQMDDLARELIKNGKRPMVLDPGGSLSELLDALIY